MSGPDCVHRCVEMGAFISQRVVYPIRNQDFLDLVRFAGQDVELEGGVRQKVLTVSHARALTVSRSRCGVRAKRGGVILTVRCESGSG